MTYRRILKSAVQAFVIAGTFMFTDVEKIYATGTRVYSNFEEFKNQALTGLHNQLEVCHRERQKIWLQYVSGSDVLDLLDRWDRLCADIEELRQVVEASDNPTDIRQHCESRGCTVGDFTILDENKANTTPSVGTWSQHDENIDGGQVSRYEKKWTEDRQNDDTNSWNSSESEYESSKKYEHEKNSERINILKAKLNSRKSPKLIGARTAMETAAKTVVPGGKVVRRIFGKGKSVEKIIRGAEKANEISDKTEKTTKVAAAASGDNEAVREILEETTIETATAIGRGVGTPFGPVGTAIGGAAAGAGTAGILAMRKEQKEIDRKAESIKSIEEDNENFALVEKAAEGDKEAKEALFSVFGKNNEGDNKAPSKHNFLQTLRRNQAQKLKATIAAGSGPMTPHLDHMKKKFGRKVEKSLKEEEGP